jgi:hypothetical protein
MKARWTNPKDKVLFTEHCMRMNEVILARNNKLKHLTDEQYNTVLANASDRSYKQMGKPL